MAKSESESEAGSEKAADVIKQDETRCRILGFDAYGWTHVHDPDRDRIVVVSKRGIDEQVDLEDVDHDLADWMHFVDDRRTWWKVQWVGYEAGQVFGGTQ